MKNACSSDTVLVSCQRECDVTGLWFLQGRIKIYIGALGGKNRKESPPLKPG